MYEVLQSFIYKYQLKGEKRVRNHLEKKENELIGFLKREFNIGYHVAEAK